MTDKQLSPAAQAVMDAYHDAPVIGVWPGDGDAFGVAAALYAAVNQVVPIEYEDIHGCWYEKKNRVREQFLDIAKELEAL